MRDADVRAALHATELARYEGDPHTRIIDELGIHRGEFRIDVAVVNGALHGYELKSARDTLSRLPAQAAAYSTVFDQVTLVAAECHLWRAAEIVPTWWGLCVAVPGTGGVHLLDERAGVGNPAVDAYSVAQLLWRAEALELLEQHGAARGVRSRPAPYVWAALAERLELPTLRTAVREVLKTRTEWRQG